MLQMQQDLHQVSVTSRASTRGVMTISQYSEKVHLGTCATCAVSLLKVPTSLSDNRPNLVSFIDLQLVEGTI